MPVDHVLDAYNGAMAQIAGLSKDASVEQLTFRMKVEWEKATEKEKKLCEEKVGEACRAVCGVIAPNASEELFKYFIKRANASNNELDALITAYKQAPTKGLKTQILSIYALRYSSTELKQIHAPFESLSDRQIKKARNHAKIVGVGFRVENIVHHRVRIDPDKLEHFLLFIDQPYFYQDVSYGTRTVKLDSGQEMVMPNVVRTVGRSTMVEQYHQHGREEEYEPLSKSTLYRILKVRGASQRKSLQGLDNTAASGAESFDTLTKVVGDLEQCGARHEWCEETLKDLKAGKRYLKTSYRAHCRDDSDECPHHCRQHALSDIECAEFQAGCHHEHLEVCPDCEGLEATMESILTQVRESKDVQFYSQDHKEDLLYDAAQAQEMVLQWKAHILRAENQDLAKTDAVLSVRDNTVFILMDWAMKFTQMRYREKQSEWFGKRGMNWHISCVLSKPAVGDHLELVFNVHLFDSCSQDSFAVYAILVDLLKNVKAAKPQITGALLRSDGAGCYQGNTLITPLHRIYELSGIKPLR